MASRTYANTGRGSGGKRSWDNTSSNLFDDFVSRSRAARKTPTTNSGTGSKGTGSTETSNSSRLIMYDFSCSPGKKISPSLRREEPRASNGGPKVATGAQAKKPKRGGGKGEKGKRGKPKLLAVFDFESEEEEEEEEGEEEEEEAKVARRIQSKSRPKKPLPIPPVSAITPAQAPAPAPVRFSPLTTMASRKPASVKASTKWKKVQRPEKVLIVEQSSDEALLSEGEPLQTQSEDVKPRKVRAQTRPAITKWKGKSPTKSQALKSSPSVVEPPRGRGGLSGGAGGREMKRRGTGKLEMEGPTKKAKISLPFEMDLSQEPEIFLGPSIVPKRKLEPSPVPSRQMKWTLRSHIRVAEEARLAEEGQEEEEEEEEEEEGEEEEEEEGGEEEGEGQEEGQEEGEEEEGEEVGGEEEEEKEAEMVKEGEDKKDDDKETTEEEELEGEATRTEESQEAEEMITEPETSEQIPSSEHPSSQGLGSEESPEMSCEDPLGDLGVLVRGEGEGEEGEKEGGEEEREKVQEVKEGEREETRGVEEGEMRKMEESKEAEEGQQSVAKGDETEEEGDVGGSQEAEMDVDIPGLHDPVVSSTEPDDTEEQPKNGPSTGEDVVQSKTVSQPVSSPKADSHGLEPEHRSADEPTMDESLETPDLSLSEPLDNPTFSKKFERHLEEVVRLCIHLKALSTQLFGMCSLVC